MNHISLDYDIIMTYVIIWHEYTQITTYVLDFLLFNMYDQILKWKNYNYPFIIP